MVTIICTWGLQGEFCFSREVSAASKIQTFLGYLGFPILGGPGYCISPPTGKHCRWLTLGTLLQVAAVGMFLRNSQVQWILRMTGIWINGIFANSFPPLSPLAELVYSPSVKLSEIPSLRTETLLSQCNYICQTHLLVCQKNASMISLLVAEVVPRNMWHGNYRILFGRIVNCIAYFLVASNCTLIPGLLTFAFVYICDS